MALFKRSIKAEKRDASILLSQFTQSLYYQSLVKTISVNRQSALSIPAFSNAIKVISQTVATLPTFIFKKTGENVEKAPYHYLYKLVNSKPNGYQTAFDFWELIVRDLILEGNAFCLIERGGKYNDITALHPLTASLVVKEWDSKDGCYIYRYNNREEAFVYSQDQIWHIQNSGDGITGISVIDQYEDVIKQTLVIESFTSQFFEQGPNSNLILETPEGTEAPNENAIKAIKLLWKRINKQSDKHIPIVTPGGMTIKELQKTNLSESQLIELKSYMIQQIARIFQLPPHILSDLSKSSFNNIQEQNRNILTYAVDPYLKRIENSVNVFLMHDYEYEKYFCDFKSDALTEANPKEKAELTATLVKQGVMTINQAKATYGLPPVENGDETIFFDQMTTLNNIVNPPKEEIKK